MRDYEETVWAYVKMPSMVAAFWEDRSQLRDAYIKLHDFFSGNNTDGELEES